MRVNTDEPKKPTTIRLNSQNLKFLQAAAEKDGRTVSALIDTAVDEYVKRQTNGIDQESGEELCIEHDDMSRLMTVLETMKRPCPISLFVQILKLQRPEKETKE